MEILVTGSMRKTDIPTMEDYKGRTNSEHIVLNDVRYSPNTLRFNYFRGVHIADHLFTGALVFTVGQWPDLEAVDFSEMPGLGVLPEEIDNVSHGDPD